jgi:hypothetical protein
MDIYDLTGNQFKRAAAIKERIEALNRELRGILGASARSGAAPARKRRMSAAVRRKIAAAQKARWVKMRRG